MPPADAQPTSHEISQLRDILRTATSSLTSLTKRTRAHGTLSSADGKRISRLKRLVTWLHTAMVANRNARRRARLGEDVAPIFHIRDMLVDGQPRVMTFITEKHQDAMLGSALDTLRFTSKFSSPALVQHLFEVEADAIADAMWIEGVLQADILVVPEQSKNLLATAEVIITQRNNTRELVKLLDSGLLPNPLLGDARRVLSADTHE